MTLKGYFSLGALLLAYGGYVVGTGGGLVCFRMKTFDAPAAIQIEDGLNLHVSLKPTEIDLCLPFIVQYYGTKMPCGLGLEIWDESKESRTLEISEVILGFSDGEVVRYAEVWSGKLEPRISYNSTSEGVVETEDFMLIDQIKGLILKHMDVRVTLTGRLIKASGQVIPFKGSLPFKAKSGSEVGTHWKLWANC